MRDSFLVDERSGFSPLADGSARSFIFPVRVPMCVETCEACDGTELVNCKACDGSGEQECNYCYGDDTCLECLEGIVDCDTCEGSGKKPCECCE